MTPGSLFDFYLKFCFSVSKKELCIYFVLLNGLLEYSKPSSKNSVWLVNNKAIGHATWFAQMDCSFLHYQRKSDKFMTQDLLR